MTKKQIKTSGKSFDFILFVTVLILLAMGIVMVLSASSPSALAESGNSYAYVSRQAVFAVLGIALMLFISKIDYHEYSKFAGIAYVGSIIILAAVPLLGSSAKGATRWLEIGGIRFQPSEIAKIALIIFYANWFIKNKDNLKILFDGFIKPFLYLLPIAIILVIFQDHLSATIIIVLVISIMMLMAGTKLRYFITLGTVSVVGGTGILLALAKFTEKGAYRISRITTFINPWNDIHGDGWQIIQSLYAIGSGGLFGVGLGESKQKYLYIPEPHNDFIFAVLAEELGFIGCATVIVLFAIFIWRGLLTAMKAPDMFGSLLAVGITSLIGLQAIMNIAVVTSSMPNTGISLPFFSYGGTALVILLCSVRHITKYFKKLQKGIEPPVVLRTTAPLE